MQLFFCHDWEVDTAPDFGAKITFCSFPLDPTKKTWVLPGFVFPARKQ